MCQYDNYARTESAYQMASGRYSCVWREFVIARTTRGVFNCSSDYSTDLRIQRIAIDRNLQYKIESWQFLAKSQMLL